MLINEKQNMKGLVLKKYLNSIGNHRANSERCPGIKKHTEINRIMAHRNVGFLEARKIVEKWSQPCVLFRCGKPPRVR
jgi:hypothetical protein